MEFAGGFFGGDAIDAGVGTGTGLRKGSARATMSTTPADENSPNFAVNGATRQKYRPGARSLTCV
jgi:hypothetical protein